MSGLENSLLQFWLFNHSITAKHSMNAIANLFKPAHDHMLAKTASARQILSELAAMPPYHPSLEQYELEDGLVSLNCFYEIDPGQQETETDPRIHMQLNLIHCYVGNIDVVKGLTTTQAEDIEAAILGSLE